MFNIGGGELLVILLLGLLVLGPERLPKAIGQVGRYIAQLRALSSGFQDEIRRAMDPADAPFRPGEEKARARPVDEEVRVVGVDPLPDDEADDEAHDGVIDVTAEDGAAPDENVGDRDAAAATEDIPPDQGPALESGGAAGNDGDGTTAAPRPTPRLDGPAPAAPGSVTSLHGRNDGDARAAG